VDWDLFRIFVAVAETGSFLRAAKRLRLSHPTVGRRMLQLEASLGVTLFARARHGVTLTDQGSRLLVEAKEVASSVLRAETAVATAQAGAGVVRVSVGATLAAYWLMPHVAAFQDQHPNIGIEFITHPYPVSVRKREADLVLRLTDAGQENLVGRKIGRLGVGFYASRQYVARRELPNRTADWAGHKVVGFADQDSNTELASWSNRIARRATTVVRCSSQADMLAATRAGIGICPLSCFVGDLHSDLVRLAPHKLASVIDMWLLAHPDLVRLPVVEKVFKFIAASAKVDSARLRG
jgi:DNA-binding transcriptional LysR family regulator